MTLFSEAKFKHSSNLPKPWDKTSIGAAITFIFLEIKTEALAKFLHRETLCWYRARTVLSTALRTPAVFASASTMVPNGIVQLLSENIIEVPDTLDEYK